MRAQTTLPALGVALLMLSVTLTVGLAVADAELAEANLESVEQQASIALSERLVAQSSPLTVRRNVLDREAMSNVTELFLREYFGVSERADVTLRINGRVVLGPDTPGDTNTFDRIVLLHSTQQRTIRPNLTRSRSVTLPRRSTSVSVTLTQHSSNVTRVRVNDRVALSNTTGLSGSYQIGLSRFETSTISFRSNESLPTGNVILSYRPSVTTRARLSVNVDV